MSTASRAVIDQQSSTVTLDGVRSALPKHPPRTAGRVSSLPPQIAARLMVERDSLKVAMQHGGAGSRDIERLEHIESQLRTLIA